MASINSALIEMTNDSHSGPWQSYMLEASLWKDHVEKRRLQTTQSKYCNKWDVGTSMDSLSHPLHPLPTRTQHCLPIWPIGNSLPDLIFNSLQVYSETFMSPQPLVNTNIRNMAPGEVRFHLLLECWILRRLSSGSNLMRGTDLWGPKWSMGSLLKLRVMLGHINDLRNSPT